MARGSLQYWVALNLVFHERLGSLQKIVRSFDSIHDAFNVSVRDLEALGVGPEPARELVSPRTLDRADKELDRLTARGFHVITRDHDDYPERLREIYDPPVVLYCIGKTRLLNDPALAVVGARRPTPYGRAVAEKMAEDLAARGLLVISGLAAGIDSAAHWGALKSGTTAAVLGCGLDRIYPKENRRLYEKIAESGLVLTEYPLGSRPLSHHFPLRNRIISGLALAVVVVEAALRSGSLITARLALDQNREVMAVPGNITSELSRGTNWLIKSGARPVESWEDVVDELPAPWNQEFRKGAASRDRSPVGLTDQEDSIISLLNPDELRHVDELVSKTGLSVSEILSILLSLEIKGCVTQRPGHYYQRKL